MAGLLLAGAGAAVGGAIGGTILGISTAVIGQTLGAVAGSIIDQYLFSSTSKVTQEGPRLTEVNVLTSVEGSNILRGYGRFKVAGNVIWAARLREQVVTTRTKTGGKGGGGGSRVTTKTYNYYASFAVGLCEGEIQGIGRVWADGSLLDLSQQTYRVYRGTEDQNPDSLIETKEGSGNVPAYRGLAYVVFEDMLINDYGNRIPQLTFEVTRPVARADNNAVSDLITGVDLIPGTTEFGYHPDVVEQLIYSGGSVVERRPENAHSMDGISDWHHAMNQLTTNLPNCNTIVFVVTWFGDDLRIGNCTIQPKVENHSKLTDPISWHVAGLDRTDAAIISAYNGNPAFGGTPTDVSVYRAVVDLKARGFEVIFYPFIIMDVPSGNTLPDPYSDGASGTGQAVYPWRGRITCSPAAGYSGTVDKTATAATQVASFLGSASAGDFSGSAGLVNYSGPSEWSYRRFILHMAELCRQAGGVDYFCIGTEMVGATTIRSSSSNYPFVSGLVSLAAEVKSLIPSAELGYAADWSEYHSHRPADGTGDVYFNMDPLWTSPDIGFIGIDNYLPISDWRDSDSQADYGNGTDAYGNPQGVSIYDLVYLKGQINGGELYDYYYASESDRMAQVRTPIVDSAYGKHWVFRQKDIRSWWENAHYNRPAGVESGTPTAWVPEGKHVIFTEYGCPAINKGTNQPNVFFDPKSSESHVPHFSAGGRDDEIQRQYIRAMVEFWSDGANNPTSSVYGLPMVDGARLNYWSYDARPWPTFPTDGDSWADQSNWQYGHWISGRIDAVYLPDLLHQMADDYGVTADVDFSRAYGSCDGFVLQAKTSFRSAIEPLSSVFSFNIIESGGTLKAVSHQESFSLVTLTLDDIADNEDASSEPVVLTRAQESDLPSSLSIKFLDTLNDYEMAAAEQRREVVEAESQPATETPIVLDFSRAQQLVDVLLYSAWARRTRGEFGVLPEFIYLEPGDTVTLDVPGILRPMRIEGIVDSSYRKLTTRSFDLGIFQPGGGVSRTQPLHFQPVSTPVILAVMDLPIIASEATPYQPYVAAYTGKWTGVNLYKSITTSDYTLDSSILAPTVLGETVDVFDSGVTDVWDYANTLKIKLYSGSLSTLDELQVLNGYNSVAIENSNGGWEIVQFVNQALIGSRTYALTKLLRGQLGTEDQMEDGLPVGSRVVLLESTIQQMGTGLGDIGRAYNLRYGPADRDIGDSTYLTGSMTPTGRGLRPYSTVHIAGELSGGDMLISWVRRTRVGGDSWDYSGDVPLNEAYEAYEVDVLDGLGSVVRTLAVTGSTTVTYTAAQQSADGLSAPFDVVVYQISDQVGRGIGRRATLNG